VARPGDQGAGFERYVDCDRRGILLIADEIQTGFGRTGKMFAIEHGGMAPDLITVAKSLAGGFPLSGVIGRASVMDAVESGGLGGTYGGNPVACAAALAVLDVIKGEDLLARANQIGERIKSRLELLASQNGVVPIGAIRGPGAMTAFEIFTDRLGTTPDPAMTKRVTHPCPRTWAAAAVLRQSVQCDPHPGAAYRIGPGSRRGARQTRPRPFRLGGSEALSRCQI
jgi:4-aminobutyrate aminotransferase-like enzyme